MEPAPTISRPIFRRNRLIRPLKYVFTVLTLSFVSVWAMTTLRWAYFFGDHVIVGVASGRFDGILLTGHPESVKFWRETVWRDYRVTDPEYLSRPTLGEKGEKSRGFVTGHSYPEQLPSEFLAFELPKTGSKLNTTYGSGLVLKRGDCRVYSLLCPLWVPTVLLLLPTILLIWKDLPYPQTHCRACNFNLESNSSGRCPECGTPLTARQRINFGIDVPTIRLGTHRRHRPNP